MVRVECALTWTVGPPPDTFAMYCMMYLAATVLPAPDSPLMMTHWFSESIIMLRYMLSVSANTCGGFSYDA